MDPIVAKSNLTTMGTLSLATAIRQLADEGYTEDFNLKDPGEDFVIDHVFRFDVMTDPSDQSVLYAIRCPETGIKGILVNGYGRYSDSEMNRRMQKVQRWEDQRHDQV